MQLATLNPAQSTRHDRNPPGKLQPRVKQVWLFRSVPSQTSSPSLTWLLQVDGAGVDVGSASGVADESARSGEIPVYIMCHHGSRSVQVTMWLAQQGFKNIFNVRDGIDAYARQVDQSVGFY